MVRPGPSPSAFLRSAVLCGLALLLSAAASAQVVRPHNSLYVLLRGGATLYHGDIDVDTDDNLRDAESQILDQLADAGPGLGAEVGYQFDEHLSLGLNYMFLWNRNLDVSFGPFETPQFQGYFTRNDDGVVHQIRALFRHLPYPDARITPVIEFGGTFVIGNGTEAERRRAELGGPDDDRVFGFGPVAGLGLDLALSPRVSVVGGLQAAYIFPDVALDGADPGPYGQIADDADYDIVANLGVGLKYAFFDPAVAANITAIECPGELVVGETATYTVSVQEDATQPVQIAWDFGDGDTSSQRVTTHTFDQPGTYTVTATVTNEAGTDSAPCLVTVEALAPMLACEIPGGPFDLNDEVEVNASVQGTEPVEILVDFGDGATASALPARHRYAAPGTYTVTITATNAAGSDTCTFPVVIEDRFCDEITELNSVFFGYGSADLTADARARLDENIEILRRCPEICVTIYGYSDGDEPAPEATAQARADAVLAYYVSQGIDEDRLRAVGRGTDPASNPKEDPGIGDSRARRADSVPSSCVGF